MPADAKNAESPLFTGACAFLKSATKVENWPIGTMPPRRQRWVLGKSPIWTPAS